LTGRSAVDALQGVADRGKDAPAPSAGADRAAAPSYLIQISRRAMATDFQVYLNARHQGQGAEVALEALDVVQAVEDQLTVYRETSAVMDVNRRAADGPVAVEAALFDLLQLAIRLYDETDGAFDITSGPLSKVWGFYRRQGRFPDEAALREALQRVGTRWLELDDSSQTVRFLRPGMEINFNAVGKGYALDRCKQRLLDERIEDFLIHGGQSSVIACGSRTGQEEEAGGWTVALRHPLRQNARLAEVVLRDRGLGTSGSGTQFFHHRGRRYGHVLDPRTGRPAEGVLSATVLAPSAALADALSTAFFVMGRHKAEQYCAEHPELSAILVCPGRRSGSTELSAFGMDESDWRRVEEEPARK
jgi:thiamine biosynthesis lipoprotein